MFDYQKFDVEIARSLSVDGLRWPSPGEAAIDSGLGCNRSYIDLRGLSWSVARRIHDLEASLIKRIEAAAEPGDEYERIEDELCEDDEGLLGLDIGVASATSALCAAGCVTCCSCNAGAYGDGKHHERYPLVGFFAKPRHVELLLRCAEEADAGLENTNGMIVAFADDIRNMPRSQAR